MSNLYIAYLWAWSHAHSSDNSSATRAIARLQKQLHLEPLSLYPIDLYTPFKQKPAFKTQPVPLPGVAGWCIPEICKMRVCTNYICLTVYAEWTSALTTEHACTECNSVKTSLNDTCFDRLWLNHTWTPTSPAHALSRSTTKGNQGGEWHKLAWTEKLLEQQSHLMCTTPIV